MLTPETNPQINNLLELLESWVARQPTKPLYTFWHGEGQEPTTWTYEKMATHAKAIAVELKRRGLTGKRAVLLYPPGLDYIAGFLGCLYAGVVAVPAYPPDPTRLERTVPRLQSIIKDCDAQIILTDSLIHSMSSLLGTHAPDLSDLEWLASDALSDDLAADWETQIIASDSLAFLQYTSGSTGNPKGVMLTHGNLLANLELIQTAFGVESGKDSGVSWLPPYHDMGLIGGILGTLQIGGHTILMSPLTFLQHPYLWLKAISEHRATASGGPNFAFEMCARKVTAEQKSQLDLSHWKVAFCGAEPILPGTVDRFTQAFAECGFDPKSFYPCYGLAEGTLIVSGAKRGQGEVRKTLHKSDFLKHEVTTQNVDDAESMTLISCGQNLPGQTIRVVRPDTLHPCEDGQIGEILVKGPSVAQGYWNQPELTQASFALSIPATGEGPFLRTGDLGFLDQGELFVTGRLKDLIIIRGQNHYPQDIERSLEESDSIFRPGCSVAFSITQDFSEKLILVAEADAKKLKHPEQDLPALAEKVRRQVAARHEIKPQQVVLIQKNTLPKTSSGKVRRSTTREEFLNQELEILHVLKVTSSSQNSMSSKASDLNMSEEPSAVVATSQGKAATPPGEQEIQTWLIAQLADHLEVSVDQVHPEQPLSEFGLDSKDAVNLSGDLEDWLGRRLSPTLLWKYPTVKKLSEYLAQDSDSSEQALA